ncbi:hypothetical protein RJ641_023798 [Dillenia turbinata]|uniref:Uncharacterized protein n=1 Tax=Dillenia turbinata TaxID=194707 RepID=A0AAN8UAA7_9MAGN
MGRENRQRKSSFSFFGLLKSNKSSNKSRKGSDSTIWEEPAYTRRVWPSEDVGDPRVDRQATEFIARFHETRVSEAERQIHPSTTSAPA